MNRARKAPEAHGETVLRVIPGRRTSRPFRSELVPFLDAAFGEPVGPLFRAMTPVAHVVAEDESGLLAHAMWVDRYLGISPAEPLRTAYVEFVATRVDVRRQGLARSVLGRLVDELRPSYALAALCPANPAIYRHLGWRSWEGPLPVRHPSGRRESTPDEHVMLMDLSLDLRLPWDLPLSVEWRPGEVW